MRHDLDGNPINMALPLNLPNRPELYLAGDYEGGNVDLRVPYIGYCR